MASRKQKPNPIVFDASEVEFEDPQQAHGTLDVKTLAPEAAPTVPFNALEEIVILVTCIIDNSALELVARWVRREDFLPSRGAIFAAIQRVAGYRKDVTFDAVFEDLRRIEGARFAKEEFLPFRELLPLAAPREVLVDHVAIVRGRSQLRQFVSVLDIARSRCVSIEPSRPGDAFAEHQTQLSELMARWRQSYPAAETNDAEKSAAAACAAGKYDA